MRTIFCFLVLLVTTPPLLVHGLPATLNQGELKDSLNSPTLTGPRYANYRWGEGDNFSISYHFVNSPYSWSGGSTTVMIYPIVEDSSPFPTGTREEMRIGIHSWSAVADIRFYEVEDPNIADIVIGQDPSLGALGRAYTANGTGRYYKAEFMLNGSSVWSLTGEGSAFMPRNVACHEVGHILGLDHTFTFGNVMYYSYDNSLSKPGLDDTYWMQTLYGAAIPTLAGERKQSSPARLDIVPGSDVADTVSSVTALGRYEILKANLSPGAFTDSAGEEGFLNPGDYWEVRMKPPEKTDPGFHAKAVSYCDYVMVTDEAPIATKDSVLSYKYSLCHTIGQNEVIEVSLSTDGLTFETIHRYDSQTCTHPTEFSMETATLPLAQYEGKPIYLRFTYKLRGSHFTGDSGAWIDDVVFNNVLAPGTWEVLPGVVPADTDTFTYAFETGEDAAFRIRGVYGETLGGLSTIFPVTLIVPDYDIDNDGTVDSQDLLLLSRLWQSSSLDADGDFNDDGGVDSKDLLMFLRSQHK